MKKMERKVDAYLEGEKVAQHGKKPNHKIKPYVVLQYLLKYTDENNVATSADIIAFLQEHKLTAERRSIYRDIEEINKVAIMLEDDCTIDEAGERLKEDDSRKWVVYDEHKKGFYVCQREYDLNDIRLLAECVYSAKFVAEGQATRLVKVVSGFVSEYQAERIQLDVFLADRVKTNNKSVLNNIATINDAMSRRLEGQSHKPEKISFKYLKYAFDDMSQQVERKKGNKYVVSPYKLLISDGNYYLLAYVDDKQEMRTYRIDRMKEVCRTGEERTGEEAFRKLDITTYSQRVFSMYHGRKQRVKLQFIPTLLDTMIERFGTSYAQYGKPDGRHYTVEAEVDISDQFYGWLLGFGKRVKMLYPADEVDKFKAYIDKIRDAYQ